MSQIEFYEELRQATSPSRLVRYFTLRPGIDDLEAFSLYLWIWHCAKAYILSFRGLK